MLCRIGKTSSGQPVDMDHLDFLVSSGHDRNLAAEALRLVRQDGKRCPGNFSGSCRADSYHVLMRPPCGLQSDNDQWAALDILSNELSSTQLQISMADKLATRKKARKKTPASKDRVRSCRSASDVVLPVYG